VTLAAGASVPGDARLIGAKDLFGDQAMLTDEYAGFCRPQSTLQPTHRSTCLNK